MAKNKQTGEITIQNPVGAMVRKQEQDYTNGASTTISKYVQFDLYENLNKIDAYLNSKHVSGDKDSMGRDKPFFNIVTAAVNIWYRATDIDRKNIKVRATKSRDALISFIATIYLQNWMRKENFGVFLNDWGRSLARYGSSVVKFVKKDGQLHSDVIPWNRLIIDSINFEQNPVIEVLELTEAELRQREGYDQIIVDQLCNALNARQTLDRQRKDNKNDYIKLYEVHGNMPLSWLTGKEEDADTYTQQMQVISYVAGKQKGEWDDFTLVSGKEENPYMITHLIREDGRSQSIGAVEHLFQAQWMMNHTVFSIKNQLDLASKLIFQTSDTNYAGRNALTNIENGDILITKPNESLTQLNNNSHDITSLQNFGAQWKALAQEISNTPDALRGTTAPSGTAWRQVNALQQEANSLFELMTENKGLAIEDMMTRFVLPFIKGQMDNTAEVAAILEGNDIDRIDSIYIPQTAIKSFNSKMIDHVLEGTPRPDLGQEMQQVQSNLSSQGNTRFFSPSEITSKTWKEIFKDLEWNMEVDVTGETRFDKEDLDTLTTVFQTIANPVTAQVLNTPQGKLIFNKILSKTNAASPIELQSLPPSQPSVAPPGGGVAAPGGLSAVTQKNAV